MYNSSKKYLRNKLSTVEDVRELENCNAVSSLGIIPPNVLVNFDEVVISDLSYNNLSDPDVMEVLAKMQSLHVLNMIGNPLLRKTIDYRRNLLYKCKDITYLDSRPVTEKDRICLKAWAKVSCS